MPIFGQRSGSFGLFYVIAQHKTNTSRRSVKLPQSALLVLKGHIEGLEENQRLLFTTDSGKPINPRFLIKHFKGDLRGAGLPEIRLHDLRHIWGTLLLSANVQPDFGHLFFSSSGHSG